MKTLLVIAICLGCKTSMLSITKFETMSECDAARDALVEHTEEPGLFGPSKAFDGVTSPQCIPYAVPR